MKRLAPSTRIQIAGLIAPLYHGTTKPICIMTQLLFISQGIRDVSPVLTLVIRSL